MKKILVAFLFLGLGIQVHAQIDSLLGALDSEMSVRERIKTHNRIAFYYSRNDTTQFLFHRHIMDSLSSAENDTLGKYLVNSLDVIYYTNRDELSKVEKALRRSLSLAKILKSNNFVSGSYYELSILKKRQNQLDSAKYYGEKCYEVAKVTPGIHPVNLTVLLTNIGRIEQEQNNFKSALEFYFEAEKIALGMDDSYRINSLANIHIAMSDIYKEIKDTSLALQYLISANKLYEKTESHKFLAVGYKNLADLYIDTKKDSAIYYFELALQSARKINNQFSIGLISNNLGDYWYSESDYSKALEYHEQAFLIFSKIGRTRSIADTRLKIAYVKYQFGQLREAIELVDSASHFYQSGVDLKNHLLALKLKGQILSGLGRYEESSACLNRSLHLQDSLNDLIYNEEVKTIQTKYETAKKENEIQEQKLIIEQKTKQRIVALSIVGLLGLLTLGLIGIIFQNKKRKSVEVKLKNQKIKELEQKNKILGLSSLIEGQETERIRIAKDLHDGLGGILSSVKAHYGKIKEEFRAVKNMQVYDRAQAMMDEAVDEVRRISHNMMPPMLRINGLAAAVSGFLENVASSHNMKLVLDIRNLEERIDENKALFIYRIIQELTNNVIKHAEASEIQFQMIRLDNQIQIIFEDNGKGFDYDAEDTSGVGLRSINSRVDYLDGEIDFDSRLGVGTTVEISLRV